MEDEYDIMPHKAFSDLKKQVDELKKGDSDPEMVKTMNNLSKQLGQMMDLFKAAGEEMKLEERQTATFNQQVKPLMDKLDTIIKQNQKIASGMIAVADLVNEAIPKLEEKMDAMGRPKVAKPKMRPMPPPMPEPSWEPLEEPMMPEMEAPMGPPGPMPRGPPPSRGPMPPPMPGPMGPPGMPPPPKFEEKKKKGLLGMFRK